MRGFILDSYLNSENKPWLRGGRYDLLGPRNEIIMPSYWGQVIQAGWVVKMVEHPRQEIHFKDAVGRKYTFPLELCQELAVCPIYTPTNKAWSLASLTPSPMSIGHENVD